MSRDGDVDVVVPATTIAGIALASVLVPLNSTMIAVALPRIADDFDISKSGASILITLYLVAMLIGQPLSGRVADTIGARRLAAIAVLGFAVGCAGAMVAPWFWMLVVMRTIQAGFASALAPSVLAMLRHAIPAAERGRAFGVQGSVIGVGAALGPVIGGVLTAAFGWRAIFGVNLPVVLVVLAVMRRPLPTVAPVPEPVVGRTGFVFNGVFGAAFSIQALSTFAQYGLLIAVPIVLDTRGWNEAALGIALSCLTAGLVVTGPLGGRLGDALGRRLPIAGGIAVTLVVVAAAAIAGDGVPSAMLVATLLLFGIGLGMATPSLQTAGIEAAPPSRAGSAAGLLSTSRYVGSVSSTLVLAGVMNDDGSGLSTLLAVCVVLLALCLAASPLLPGRVLGTPRLVP